MEVFTSHFVVVVGAGRTVPAELRVRTGTTLSESIRELVIYESTRVHTETSCVLTTIYESKRKLVAL